MSHTHSCISQVAQVTVRGGKQEEEEEEEKEEEEVSLSALKLERDTGREHHCVWRDPMTHLSQCVVPAVKFA